MYINGTDGQTWPLASFNFVVYTGPATPWRVGGEAGHTRNFEKLDISSALAGFSSKCDVCPRRTPPPGIVWPLHVRVVGPVYIA